MSSTLLGLAGVTTFALLVAYVCRCRHNETRRAYVNGRLHYYCDRCGRSWPAITWTREERKRMGALQKRLRQSRASVATVVEIDSRRKAQ